MIYAGILAGGRGVRVNNDLPKQFVEVCGKPLLYHTLQRFCDIEEMDRIILSCIRAYIELAYRIVETTSAPGRITIVEGGQTRHESLMSIINYIRGRGCSANDKILVHEAARPLIDRDVIVEHIRNLARVEATNTLFGAVDTMMMSVNGEFIDQIPPKKQVYHGQTPQGYDLMRLIRVIEEEITEEDLEGEVDLCAIYLRNGRRVKIVKGNERLFKVTYPRDIALLEYYLRGEGARS